MLVKLFFKILQINISFNIEIYHNQQFNNLAVWQFSLPKPYYDNSITTILSVLRIIENATINMPIEANAIGIE